LCVYSHDLSLQGQWKIFAGRRIALLLDMELFFYPFSQQREILDKGIHWDDCGNLIHVIQRFFA
jgi:hypothetical protein